ncbi:MULTISPECIES: DUF4173 domain-containing protein [Mesorhizobium]|uniref:DUF4153 domain-containing protein n=1 Tax=Mesorhizobium sp. TaxID=1871066 RepID=UPI0004949D65|nr:MULTISPECIES: DUF4173 domain-containing protein [Mesorhizobium]RWM71171.1 MAG: DUF4173 domain-containing protein [Mesorhizobium sp.]TIO24200.1 MAG: DUF4173 domain-containing protein [Mesorhizobium sp.]TJV64216.1 MAG: DUF4173 domain-containing protein [Mesorhizobium sp.]
MTSLLTAAPSFCARFGVAVLLAALADFFFYGQPVGITLFLFGTTLAAAVAAIHPSALSARGLSLGLAALLVGLLPLIENVSALSVAIGLAAMVVFALWLVGRLRRELARIAGQVVLFLLAAPFRFVHDFFRWRKAARRLGQRRIRLAAIGVWIMPLTLGAVFLALFGAANPVIEYWLSLIDLHALLDLIQLPRLAFWLVVLAGVWVFLRPRLPRFFRRIAHLALPIPLGVTTTKPAKAIEDIVFGKAAILRALVVFNILFAVQTALDATYLWGGIALPDGLTYAAYAHRGAYPLIVTALLAAGFVLAALRPGSAPSSDPFIRRLVYVWVAQNIVLVISSILRLDLYIGIFALTYWRVAALVWMGLVAAGLALIIARIALEKSNEWLLSANLLTLSLTLYACSFINFAALIANYNVEHSFEMTGRGTKLDFWYLRSLGPSAWPALYRFLEHQAETNAASVPSYRQLARLLGQDQARYRAGQENWRAWSFRDWRLLRTVDTYIPFVVPQGSELFAPGR